MAVYSSPGYSQKEQSQLLFTVLLQKHRLSRSAHPRDKASASLGLGRLVMDPCRDSLVMITRTTTAKALLMTYRRLSVLCCVEHQTIRRTSDLPSWAPNDRVTINPCRTFSCSSDLRWKVLCSNNTEPEGRLSSDHKPKTSVDSVAHRWSCFSNLRPQVQR